MPGTGDQSAMERGGTAGLDDGDPRDLVDKAQFLQFHQDFSIGRAVAQIAARHHNSIRDLPVQLIKELEHHGLLAFESKRIDGIHQIKVRFFGKFLNQAHCDVKISLDLQGERTKIHGLG